MSILNGLFGRKLKTSERNVSYELFESYAKVFGVHCAESGEMLKAVELWNKNYQRCSTQLMKLICKEAAKLTLTDFSISIDNKTKNENAVLFDKYAADFEDDLSRYIEQGIALGGLMFKPSEEGIVFVSPTNFVPISYDIKGNISSVIFVEYAFRGGMYYTKLEYHHWVDNVYSIDTACFKSKERYSLGYACELIEIPEWAGITAKVYIEDLKTPLFTYFRMPGSNNIDEQSNYGLSLCSAAMEYIYSFDNTYKLFKKDLELSQKKILADENTLNTVPKCAINGREIMHNPLPDLIVGLSGVTSDSIQIFDPKCAVDDYKTALQLILNLISVACGFNTGYFTFDDNGVAVTATQVESENAQTVSTVVAIRKSLNTAIKSAIQQQAELLMLYDDGIIDYDITLYARDLSATPNADRERTIDLVKNGLYPLKLYLKEYEGLSDADIEEFLNSKAN